MGQQRLFPDQPDRQHVDQRGIGAALQLGLPQQPARMLRPAAQIHQQPVKDRLRRLGTDPQPLCRAQDRALGRVGRFGHMGGETVQPRDFRCQVMRRPFPPGGKGPMPGPRCPQRLPPVEMPRRPQPEAAPQDRGPIRPGRPGHQIRHRGQRHRLRAFRRQPRLQPRKVARLDRAGRGDQRHRKVVIVDLAPRHPCGQVLARQRQPHPRHPSQPGRRLRQILARLAKEGVHRHRRIQRKGRRDRARRRLCRLPQPRGQHRRNLTVLEEHVSLRCRLDAVQDFAAMRKPPVIRSNSAFR